MISTTFSRVALLLSSAALLVQGAAPPAHAALDATEKAWDGGAPPQGIYFHWYEASFYTGFAPRVQDPRRIHLELSRGQQVRATVVLGDVELDAYLDDLLIRKTTVEELVAKGVIELSTNKEFERYVEALAQQGVAEAVAARSTLGAEGYRKKSAEILSALNPDRVFRIRRTGAEVAAGWHAALLAAGDLSSREQTLDAANAALPGRVNLTTLDGELEAELARAAELARSGPADAPAFRDAALGFADRATRGRYRATGGNVEALELTAIYPAGTIEGTTTYKGEKLPEFGVTGVWNFIRRTTGRGVVGMVDYLSPNPGYGFITMLPYQFAGGITYNAIHNAGVRCQLSSTPFLPADWRKVPGERDPSKPYQNLWIASRGPTSHGCTRLGSGHMSELRQIVPTENERIEQIGFFRNLPQCHDAFDVDGDGTEEVMGVQYYQAYRSTEDRIPTYSYVANRREPFYRWLYGDNVDLGSGAVGDARIKEAPICRFVGARKAQEARVAQGLRLYEQPWARESIQFYRAKGAAPDSAAGFELNRELRKIGAGHEADRRSLRLP